MKIVLAIVGALGAVGRCLDFCFVLPYRAVRWGWRRIVAALLARPVLLFPLRLETSWVDGEDSVPSAVKVRWYPDASQLVLDGTPSRERGSLDQLNDLHGRGFRMLALPRVVALYTLGHHGGLQKLAEVAVPDASALRFRWDRERASGRDPASAWVFDFAAATKAGMGVTLQEPHQIAQLVEAEWLVAFGFDAGRSAPDVLHQVIEDSGIGCVALGTPTNAGGDAAEPRAASQRTEISAEISWPSKWPYPVDARVIEPIGLRPATDRETLARTLSLSDVAAVRLENADRVTDREDFAALAATLLLPDRPRAGMNPRGHLPVLRIGDNPYGVALTHPERWRWANLQYALGLARRHGRLLHDPAADSDRELLRFQDGIDSLPQLNDHERLEATLQQARLPNTVRLETKDHAAALRDSANLLTVAADAEERKAETLRLLRWLEEHIESGLGRRDVRERLPGECVTGYLLRRAALGGWFGAWRPRPPPAGDAPEEPALEDVQAGNVPLLALLLRRRAREVRSRGRIRAFLRAAKATRAAVEGGVLSPDELERLLLEALDAHGARVDVWFARRAFQRLSARLVRATTPGVGVFGWVERPARYRPRDAPRSQGGPGHRHAGLFLQAPSLDQGRVAAALGSLATSPESPYRVNLSSGRVQEALALADAVRQGASVGEHLGALAERLLHEWKLDECILPIRELLAGAAAAPTGEATRDYELGRMDGLKLAGKNVQELVNAMAARPGGLGAAGAAERYAGPLAALRARVAGVLDAFVDLAHAEVAYQKVRGNAARVNAWLRVAMGEALPPDAEFVRTRRTGKKLVQRVMVSFDDASADRALAPAGSVRAVLEPNWERLCRATTAAPDAALLGIARSAADPSKEWRFETTMSAEGVALVDLLFEGEAHVSRFATTALLRALRDPAQVASAAAALGVGAPVDRWTIARTTSVELRIGPAHRDAIAGQAGLAELVKASAPALEERATPDDVLWLLRAAVDRVARLRERLAGELPTLARLDAWLRDSDGPAVLGGIAPAELRALLLADAAGWDTARKAVEDRRASWLAACDDVLRPAVVVFRNPLMPESAPPLFRLELVRDVHGVVDLSPECRAASEAWSFASRWVDEIARRFERLLQPGGAARNDGDRPAAQSGSALRLLRRMPTAAVAAGVPGADGPVRCAEAQRRETLAQLVKTRYVRRSMGLLFGAWAPAALARGYDASSRAPAAATHLAEAHSEILHLFTPLGAVSNGAVAFEVDRWTDFLPGGRETTALIVNYDAPQAEAPNALVYCSPPFVCWTQRRMARAVANVVDVMRLRTLTLGEIAGRKLASEFPAAPTCRLSVD